MAQAQATVSAAAAVPGAATPLDSARASNATASTSAQPYAPASTPVHPPGAAPFTAIHNADAMMDPVLANIMGSSAYGYQHQLFPRASEVLPDTPAIDPSQARHNAYPSPADSNFAFASHGSPYTPNNFASQNKSLVPNSPQLPQYVRPTDVFGQPYAQFPPSASTSVAGLGLEFPEPSPGARAVFTSSMPLRNGTRQGPIDETGWEQIAEPDAGLATSTRMADRGQRLGFGAFKNGGFGAR